VIPLANTAKLFARFANGVATMKVIPGAGHNTLDSQGVYRAVLQAAL
jgi:pimeloyl-ACP methyl ester carboxylesterase